MLTRRLPVIFLLPFSKALDCSKKWRWLQIFFLFVDVFFVLAWIFMLQPLRFVGQESSLPFPAGIASLLYLFFFILSIYTFDVLVMLRKDLDGARLALENWHKIKQKGKIRFIIAPYIGEIILVALVLYLDAKNVLGSAPKISLLVIGGVVVIEIFWIMRLVIWQLNLRDEDKVEAQIRQKLLA